MRMRDMTPGFMREHMWTRRHLHAYLDDGLDARDRRRLEQHAHLCPKCRRLVATLVRTLEGLHGLREAPAGAPPSISDSVIERLRRESG